MQRTNTTGRTSSRNVTTISAVMRALDRHKDRRQALSLVRQAISPNDFSVVIARLLKNPVYKAAVVGNPFPATPEKILKKIRLQLADPEHEFLWSSAVLLHFKEQISTYVRFRSNYEARMISGDYAKAQSLLDEVERELGYSIWLVASRIQLLAISQGLQAQKQYLEELLARSGSPLFAWIAYYCSLRAEENFSLASIQETLNSIADWSVLHDYATYLLNPLYKHQVTEPSHLINYEEMNPIIDRYNAHIEAARLTLARSPQCTYVIRSLTDLQAIEDVHLQRLIAGRNAHDTIEAAGYRLPSMPKEADGISASTSAELGAVLDLLTGDTRDTAASESPLESARTVMRQLLLPSDCYVAARQQLQKIGLTVAPAPMTLEIASFFARNDLTELAPSERDEIEALAELQLAPARITLPSYHAYTRLLQLADESRSTAAAATRIKQTVALLAQSSNLNTALAMLAPFYRAHLAKELGELDSANANFRELSTSTNAYIALLGRLGLIEINLGKGEIEAAAAIAVEDALSSPDRYRAYPFQLLANTLAASEIVVAPLLCAAVYRLAAFPESRWDSELSDSYEAVLMASNVSRPLELPDFGRAPLEQFFLREVCTQRVMEDSISFSTVEEIEDERIGICRKLIAVDPARAKAYADEIKIITRAQDVSRMLRQVEANMIYVDEAGIANTIGDWLKEAYGRYRILLASPDLNYQAAHIGRMLKDLLAKHGGAELQNISAPASEIDGLFEEMRATFIDAFALNAAYGLNTNLSTNIRHGTIEGHIRAPFASEGLLGTRRSKQGGWDVPKAWLERFQHLPPADLAGVSSAFEKLSARTYELVQLYRDELLHIRRDSHRKGLFSFTVDDTMSRELQGSIDAQTSYEVFLSKLFGHAWVLVDSSMAEIVRRIHTELLPAMLNACDSFDKALLQIPGIRQSGIHDATARARTLVQEKTLEIQSWFRRPSNPSNISFDLETASLVALKQVVNCFGEATIDLALEVPTQIKFRGEALNPIVELVFLLLQNAVQHSGHLAHGTATATSLCICYDAGVFDIECANTLASDRDVNDVASELERALRRVATQEDLSLADSDRNSGLVKIKKLVEADLGSTLRIELTVRDRKVVAKATFRLSESWLKGDELG